MAGNCCLCKAACEKGMCEPCAKDAERRNFYRNLEGYKQKALAEVEEFLDQTLPEYDRPVHYGNLKVSKLAHGGYDISWEPL